MLACMPWTILQWLLGQCRSMSQKLYHLRLEAYAIIVCQTIALRSTTLRLLSPPKTQFYPKTLME